MASGATAVASNPKGKDKDKPAPAYVSVKIEAGIYRLIKTVAAWRGMHVHEYLSEIARGPAKRDFAKMQQEGHE
jgi:hypothetical protein